MIQDIKSLFVRLSRDRAGSVSVITALWISAAGIGLTAGVINVNDVLRVQRALQDSSDAAARAAATQINVLPLSGLTSTALAFSSATSGTTAIGANPITVKGVEVTMTLSTGCISSLLPAGNTACSNTSMYSPSGINYVHVTQTATVPLFFDTVTTTITTSSYATSSGGLTKPLNIMLILDSTDSMTTPDPTGCTDPNNASPTRFQCMEYGVQTLLAGLTTSVDYVGFMTFPGLLTTGTGTGKGGNGIPALGTLQAYEYCANTGTITTNYLADYDATPAAAYQIIPSTLTGGPVIPMSNDYLIAGTRTLNPSSNLVKLLGKPNSCAGLQVIGGKGTFYAEAITAAQTYLSTYGSTIGSTRNAQNVIILLSDGDASSSDVPTASVSNECQLGVAAAQAAAVAGTWVYAVAYGSPTSGSCSTDGGKISACVAMQNIASSPGHIPDPSKFYSDTQESGGAAGCTSQNKVTEMGKIFASIAASLSPARVLAASCVTANNCSPVTIE